ncbi:MAG TPA: hypothetical protein VFC47_09550 [Caulobacteraceae bacterium]|nr:hypothetical protein [Caulobacteraceae bacterium]
MQFLMFLTLGLVGGVLALEASFRLARFSAELAGFAAAIAERFDV